MTPRRRKPRPDDPVRWWLIVPRDLTDKADARARELGLRTGEELALALLEDELA